MADSDVRHPVIVDTDALIAVTNTNLWDKVTEHLQLTTTNVCVHELKRHIRECSEYALEGTREQWVHTGSTVAVQPFENAENRSFTAVSCVPRPHGEDAGEESIQTEVQQHTGQYKFAISMDRHGRRSINRIFEEATETNGKAVAPTFLLYLLLERGVCTEEEFCQACGEMLQGEGWTGYQAIQAAWEAIPIDCSEYLPDDLLT